MPLQIPLQFVEFVGPELLVNGLPVIMGARAINTTSPLAGGGDLSQDRTLSITLPLNASDTHASPSKSTHHTAFTALKSGSTTVSPSSSDLITLVAGSNITLTPDTGASSITIASSGGGGSGTLSSVYKTADTSRNTTTTLTADPDLQFDILAGEVWAFMLFVRFVTAATPDFKMKFSNTSGGATLWQYHVDKNTGGTIGVGVSGDNSIIVDDTSSHSIWIIGTADTDGASNGTVSFDWAQNTSNGTDTTVKKYSWLTRFKLA